MDECKYIYLGLTLRRADILIEGIIPCDEGMISDNVCLCLGILHTFLPDFCIQDLRRHLVDPLPVGSQLVVKLFFQPFPQYADIYGSQFSMPVTRLLCLVRGNNVRS